MSRRPKLAPLHRKRIREGVIRSWNESPARVAQREELARTDRLVLRAMPGTLDQIADRTGLPRSTVAGRIRRMKADGIIESRHVHNARGFGWAKEWGRVEVER